MKLLIVDDEILIVQGLKHIIQNMDTAFTEIDTAISGMQALDKLRENAFDLMIVDVNMPSMNGLDLLQQAAKENLCHCFGIISGYPKFEYAQSAIDIGVAGYLLKPVDKKQLALFLELCYKRLIIQRNQKALLLKEILYGEIDECSISVKSHLLIVSDRYTPVETIRKKVEIAFGIQSLDLTVVVCGEEEKNYVLSMLPADAYCGFSSGIMEDAASLRDRYAETVRAMLYGRLFLKQQYIDASTALGWPIPTDDIFDRWLLSITGKTVSMQEKTAFQMAFKRMTGKSIESMLTFENPYAQKIYKVITAHYSEHLTLTDVARQIGLSGDYAGKVFKESVGMSFHDALNRYRVMRIAEELQKNPNINIEQLALFCGFTHLRNFYRVFSRFLHMSPGEYKKLIQNEETTEKKTKEDKHEHCRKS